MARALLDAAACGPTVEDGGSFMVGLGYDDLFLIGMVLMISVTILLNIIIVCGRKEPTEKKNDNTCEPMKKRNGDIGGVGGGGGTYPFVSGGGRVVIDTIDVGGGHGRIKVEGLSELQPGATLGEPTKRKNDDAGEPTKKKNDYTDEPTNKKSDDKGGIGGSGGGTYSFVSGGVFTNTVDVGGGRILTKSVNIGGGRVHTNTVDVGGGRVLTKSVNMGGGRVLTSSTVDIVGGSFAAYTSATMAGGAVGGVSC